MLRKLFFSVTFVFFLLTLVACGTDETSQEEGPAEEPATEEETDSDAEGTEEDAEEDGSAVEETPEVSYEVWIADQGLNEIHIIDGATHEIVETIDFADVGDKPHMLVFDEEGEYAYVANMGSGTMSVIRASDRQVVTTLETDEGAHAAIPSPDGKRVLVANTPGQSMTEVLIDKENEEFTVGRHIDLTEVELLQDEEAFPNNRPICLQYTADGSKAYVTLGGGGLFVFDVENFEVIKAFDKTQVGTHGCGTILSPDGKYMFANSGSTELAEYYVIDVETDEIIFTGETGGIDAHGVAFTPDDQFLWMLNRVTDDAAIIDPTTFEVVDHIEFVGDAPDLMVFSPDGKYAYISLRGPEPATGTHDMAGDTPGVSIIDVETKTKVKLIELDLAGDPHGVDLRIVSE
ncbi:DNA-binding beta-propeller fold protein YncE/predicted small lipoprotein YifL [Evansella vedderi]|uniref:DNA-binding beta-propeller fold protein YncE/predicted small lipoprotein YifL n=1 Tax=Evansella vedderi TaxID=38282 RepID=A0ABU0A027_9BACI|nr:beta-propeller fold lactonase family protein [Evansella vedderi]MDQ0256837.1 DNA-binding beta-propeller fold protein YncE/predicted small lipoprotein YifL [Evansella vedderi]